MKIILNYIAAILIIYFSVNWAADNPALVKALRAQMNTVVSAGAEKASEAFDEIKSSASQSLDK